MSMEWKLYKLNEICISISDGDHLAPPKSNNGIPFITISNVVGNSIDFCNTMFVPQEYYDRLDTKRKAQTDDILYTVVGSFGTPILIKDEKQFTFQRHIAILRPNKSVVPAFLYYTMKSSDFYSQADAYAIGSAQRTISLTSLRRMKVALPPLPTQQKIASILSTYDTLIENNTKRIRLLEQMAENLYKEWFVRFRFPGHKNVEMENGLPKGWKIAKFGDLSPIITGKKDANFATPNGQYKFFTCSKEPLATDSYSFDCFAIILAGNGDLNVKLYDGQFEAYQRTYVLSPYDLGNIYISYYTIERELDRLLVGAAGAVIKFLTKGMIENIKVIVPTEGILTDFNAVIENNYKERKLLQHQNTLLTRQRDLLLPRLMSGKLEVQP